MRRLSVCLFALALLALFGPAKSSAALEGCFGAGIDPGYVQKFDKLPGQGGTNGSVDLPYQAFYREAQSWATRPGEEPGHHSEHFHMGGCFPNGQTMTGPFTLYLVYTFHNVADYKILPSGMTAVTTYLDENGRTVHGSTALWSATPEQIAQLQAAADASGNGSVQRVYLTVTANPSSRNGFREVRGALNTEEDGPSAIFHSWHFDPRWYFTQNVAGLPSGFMPPSQLAIRNRSQIVARKADGTLTGVQYHHSGWCDKDGLAPLNPLILTDCRSKNWGRSTVAAVWPDTKDKLIKLYVTDGGGDAYVMIDPDFHNHYDAPTAACPNVDANGNCLGKFVWRPANARGEICCSQQFPWVTIPASVVASLAPGLHKIVFRSDDAAECERHSPPDCDGTQRGTWSNIEVLPFRVT